MQKLDRVVALVGALVLAVAVVAAALTAPPGAQGFALTRVLEEMALDGSLPSEGVPPSGARPTDTIPIEGPGVHAIHLNVTLTPTGAFAPGGSVIVTLTAPDGEVHEATGTVPAGATAFTLPLDALVAPVPPDAIVEAANAEEALRNADAETAGNRTGEGNWTLEVAYAASGPVGHAGLELTYSGTLVRWRTQAAPVAPEAK